MVQGRKTGETGLLATLPAAMLACALLLTPQVAKAEELAVADEGLEQGAVVSESVALVEETSEVAVVDEAAPVQTVAPEVVAAEAVQASIDQADEEPANVAPTSDQEVASEDATPAEEPAVDGVADEAIVEIAPQDDPEPVDPYDGKTFILETGVNDGQVVDAAGGKTAKKTNIQTYTYNKSDAQKWTFMKDAESAYYYIVDYVTRNNATPMVLDINGGSTKNGANVHLWTKNGTLAQLWSIVQSGSGVSFISALSEKAGHNIALDVKSGKAKNGTNIQTYKANGTAAQRFYLLDTNPSANITPEKLADGDGVYTVKAANNNSFVLDMKGGSRNNGGNVQIYKGNGTQAQKLYFESDSKGYYTITFLNSGKVLDVSGGKIIPGANVQQYSRNGTDAQKWAVTYNKDSKGNATGSITLTNKGTGLMLDLASGKTVNGTNIQVYRKNGNSAQNFVLSKTEFLPTGIVAIHAYNNFNSVLDVKGGSAADNAALQLYTSNDSLAQRYQIVRIAANTYRIRTAASGGWVAQYKFNDAKEASDYKIVQKGNSSTAETSNYNTWEAVWNGTFFSLKNTETGRYMEYVGGKTSNSTVVQANVKSTSHAQHFFYTPASLIKEGLYIIGSETGTVLDIAGGSTKTGANVQVYKSNSSEAQKFRITASGSGYKLINLKSNKAIGVSGSNVQQGAGNQVWKPEISDGGRVVFVNSSTGKVLDLAKKSSSNGTNVQQTARESAAAPGWKLTATYLVGWRKEGSTWYFYYSGKNSNKAGTRKAFSARTKNAWEKFKNYSNTSSRKGAKTGSKYLIAFNNSPECHLFVFEGKKGAWEPLFDWLCSVGTTNETDPTYGETARGDFYIRKKGYKMGFYPYEYYWSEFYINAAAMTDSWGEGQRFHSTLKTGGPNSKDWGNGGVLGQRLTHGCVRLLTANAKWIYDNCPLYTRVISY